MKLTGLNNIMEILDIVLISFNDKHTKSYLKLSLLLLGVSEHTFHMLPHPINCRAG